MNENDSFFSGKINYAMNDVFIDKFSMNSMIKNEKNIWDVNYILLMFMFIFYFFELKRNYQLKWLFKDSHSQASEWPSPPNTSVPRVRGRVER